MSRYSEAKEIYAQYGVDTEQALDTLKNIPVSVHCWQGDDVTGFDSRESLSGGIQTTGNYPGKARMPEELMADIDKAFSLMPGKKKLNLHASYAIFEDGEIVGRDKIEPKHFQKWVTFAKERNMGLDFNPTFFAHPMVKDNLTLMSHMARLKVDPENRVVMHSHPTNTLAMNYVHELDEKKLTHTLWEMCTECIVVFPDGVGVLPWMLCGTNSIGEATAKKMEEFRLVIWGMHGIYGAGKTMDETFGLIETVEKAAQIYMLTAGLPRVNTIKDSEMKELAEFFGVKYRKDFLNL